MSLQEIASYLRADLLTLLPPDFETSVTALEDEHGQSVTIEITGWPRSIPMLSRKYIFAERYGVLAGLQEGTSKAFHLSDEAKLLVNQLQNRIVPYQAKLPGLIGEVMFNRKSLRAEKTDVLRALKIVIPASAAIDSLPLTEGLFAWKKMLLKPPRSQLVTARWIAASPVMQDVARQSKLRAALGKLTLRLVTAVNTTLPAPITMFPWWTVPGLHYWPVPSNHTLKHWL